jgi:lysozyme
MRKWLLILGIAVVLAGALVVYRDGLLRFNYPNIHRFPVRGIDVSHHQGEIDWSAVAGTGTEFVFIKATEGSDFRDANFTANWDAAGRAGLARGAYHFFTFCTDGAAQAANFIATVQPPGGELPPVADVEFGGNCGKWESVSAIRSHLSRFLGAIERAYARRPVIYLTRDAYQEVVAGYVRGYPLWVRDVVFEPSARHYGDWLFWQFASNGRIPGVSGLVDLNVFRGSREEFRALNRLLASNKSPG